MPYIKDKNKRRKELQLGDIAETAGELNFQIFSYIKKVGMNYSATKLIRYVERFLGDTPNYQKYNDMVGCLVLCRNEIARRLDHDVKILIEITKMYQVDINNYEVEAIKRNGDIL